MQLERLERSRLCIPDNISRSRLQTSPWPVDFIALVVSLRIVIFNTNFSSFFRSVRAVKNPCDNFSTDTSGVLAHLYSLKRTFRKTAGNNSHGTPLSRPSINGNVLVSLSSSPHERVKYDRFKVSAEGWEGPHVRRVLKRRQ